DDRRYDAGLGDDCHWGMPPAAILRDLVDRDSLASRQVSLGKVAIDSNERGYPMMYGEREMHRVSGSERGPVHQFEGLCSKVVWGWQMPKSGPGQDSVSERLRRAPVITPDRGIGFIHGGCEISTNALSI